MVAHESAIIAFCIGVVFGYALKMYMSDESDFSPQKLKLLQSESKKALHARTQKRKERILKKARTTGQVTNDDVEDMFCISDATAGNYLAELVDNQQLEKHGSTGRGVYYTPFDTTKNQKRLKSGGF